jgi:hypothetical protein
VGVSEPWQEIIDAAYNKARALLSQESQGNSPEDVQCVNALYQVLNQLLGQQFLYTSKDANASQTKKPFSCQEDPIPGHTYALTWDPAISPRFSVITVVDCDTGRVAAYVHDNASDYRSQIIRALALAYRYRAEIEMDTAGIGASFFDQLEALGIPVKAVYKTLKGYRT